MRDSKIKKETLKTVITRIKEKKGPERTKRTLVLSKANYELLEELCEKDEVFVSDVVDELIAVYLEARD